MIVGTHELSSLRGAVTMASGGFDPLHAGHVAYFRAATELGLPILCNVSPDEWVEQKHAPLLTQSERVQVIDAIRFVDYTHAASISVAEVLTLLSPRYFVKGEDWRGRLPDEEVAACAENGVEIVFLDTVVDSSTAVLDRFRARVRLIED